MRVQAGKLNKRIEIQLEVITGRSETGAEIRKWEKHKEVWSSIKPVTAAERDVDDIETSIIKHIIKIRYTPGIKSKMRIKYKYRYFKIKGIKNISEANRMLLMECIEIKNREVT